jgi:hypothetical protein
MAQEATHTGKVEFRYDRPDASQVYLVGSFNGWNPGSHPMQRDSLGHWHCEVILAPGVYQFYYLAQVQPDGMTASRSGPSAQWSCGNLDFVVVSSHGGTIELGRSHESEQGKSEACDAADESGLGLEEDLLPLSRLESALIKGFRQLPDHESRSAFLDVLQESVYS